MLCHARSRDIRGQGRRSVQIGSACYHDGVVDTSTKELLTTQRSRSILGAWGGKLVPGWSWGLWDSGHDAAVLVFSLTPGWASHQRASACRVRRVLYHRVLARLVTSCIVLFLCFCWRRPSPWRDPFCEVVIVVIARLLTLTHPAAKSAANTANDYSPRGKSWRQSSRERCVAIRADRTGGIPRHRSMLFWVPV